MTKRLNSIRRNKEKSAQRYDDVLENIAELLYSPIFNQKLVSSTPREIDNKLQDFLA